MRTITDNYLNKLELMLRVLERNNLYLKMFHFLKQKRKMLPKTEKNLSVFQSGQKTFDAFFRVETPFSHFSGVVWTENI